MSINRDSRSPGVETRDNRRWLIGIVISIVFGLFSMLMALLGYFADTKPTAPPAGNSPAARDDDEPTRRTRPRGERRK
jgi:hypothetical protein